MGTGRVVMTATMLVTTVAAGQLAAAAPSLAATVRPTQLTLTVAKGETAKPVLRKARLTCQPAGGTHRQARKACAALARVQGDFSRLQGDGSMACTMQYDPVTVTASGTWRGLRVNYRKTYGNACTLAVTTGPVFSL